MNQIQNGTSTSLAPQISGKKRDCSKNSTSFKEWRLTLEAPVHFTFLINARTAAWQFLHTTERIRGGGRSSDNFSWHRMLAQHGGGRRLSVEGPSIRHSWALESTDIIETAGKRHQNRQSNTSQNSWPRSNILIVQQELAMAFPERARGG